MEKVKNLKNMRTIKSDKNFRQIKNGKRNWSRQRKLVRREDNNKNCSFICQDKSYFVRKRKCLSELSKFESSHLVARSSNLQHPLDDYLLGHHSPGGSVLSLHGSSPTLRGEGRGVRWICMLRLTEY